MREHGLETCDPQAEAERKWVVHTKEEADKTIVPAAGSYYMGTNIPGKPRVCMVYVGGAPKYRGICADVVARGYAGFEFEETRTSGSGSKRRAGAEQHRSVSKAV